MAHDIPTTEPAVVTVGDTWTWTKSLADYIPSDSWVLTYALVNSSAQITITASDNGDGTYLVSVAAATTANYTAGEYRWQAYATNGTTRHTVDRGEITVKPNFATESTGYDGRGPWRTILDGLETAYAAMVAGDIKSYSATIAGRTVTYRRLEDLIKAIGHAKSMVAQEEAEERLANGLGGGRKVLVRF